MKKVSEKLDEGKGLVWIDEKLLKRIDKQVEAGKYHNRSHAIEVLILEKMKE